MRVVDVQPCAVGEHGVRQVGLDDGCKRREAEHATGVKIRRLVIEIPVDSRASLLGVGVHDDARRRDGIHVGPARDSVLGLDAENLGYGHSFRGIGRCRRVESNVHL